jgi:TPR repeat protein
MRKFILILSMMILVGCGVAYKGTGGLSVYQQMQLRERDRHVNDKSQQELHRKRLKKYEAMSWEELEKSARSIWSERKKNYAKYEMARRYEYGIDVEVNLHRAYRIYREASTDSHSSYNGVITIKTRSILGFEAQRARERVIRKM